MATFNKFNAFVEHLAEGVHTFGTDQLRVALTSTANAPTAANSVLGDLTTVSTTNLDATALTTTSSAQTSGTYKLKLSDLVMTSTNGNTGPFGHIVIYNDAVTAGPTDALIGWYNYGSNITLATNESLTLDFSTSQVLFTLA